MAANIADDIEQNVLTSLWRAMPGEQTPTNPSSYLYRAAVRETVRAMKGLHNKPTVELAADQKDPQPTPESLLQSKELGGTIKEALGTLSPDRRRAVQAHLMGFEVKEIMTMQRWSYNKARNLIARGMADLRRELERRGVRG
jgi:RNA polymerase sigma factor (sigma-70 family)